MAYRPILSLRLAHEFYGDGVVPLQVRPADVPAFSKAGLLLRQNGNSVQVLSDNDDPHPNELVLDVHATTPDAFVITEGADWGHVLFFDGVEDAFEFDPAKASTRLPQSRADRLARFSFAVPTEAARTIRVHFPAVEALWAYHVTGGKSEDALEVVDPTSQMTFSKQDSVTLPDGSRAIVIRSDNPLPARARPTQKFMLQRPSAFGPETLVPVLPAAGISFKPIDQQSGNAARLQSDIYVSIW